MHAIFSCLDGDANVLQKQYGDVIRREFYEGEVGNASSGPINLFLEKSIDHPITVVHLRTPNRITYRRSQRHIQQNDVDVYVAWLIRRGGLKLSRTSGSFTATEGQIIVYDSATPFFTELACDDRGIHDSLQVYIPAHLFREHIAELSACNVLFDISNDGPSLMAAKLLELLAEHGHMSSRELTADMSTAFLQALGESMATRRTEKLRKSIADRRFEEIEQFVTRNLTNRNLSANLIAEGCKISPRYLCYILKSAGYTFSGLVWDKRLEKAKEWLVSPKMQNYLVHEIASMAGYKSAAHFSRTFKTACGCTPTEYRARMMDRAAQEEGDAQAAVPALH